MGGWFCVDFWKKTSEPHFSHLFKHMFQRKQPEPQQVSLSPSQRDAEHDWAIDKARVRWIYSFWGFLGTQSASSVSVFTHILASCFFTHWWIKCEKNWLPVLDGWMHIENLWKFCPSHKKNFQTPPSPKRKDNFVYLGIHTSTNFKKTFVVLTLHGSPFGHRGACIRRLRAWSSCVRSCIRPTRLRRPIGWWEQMGYGFLGMKSL